MNIRVHKLDEHGSHVWHYDGVVLEKNDHMVKLEAYFARDDVVMDFHTFRRGDRFIEWFYADRWYNIFQMHDVDDDHLKGWYCNVTRPARLEPGAVYAEDLALDLMVYPDGRFRVLDEDEFEALDVDEQTRQHAREALETLKTMVRNAEHVFAAVNR